jgi:hypothetical protein
MEASYQLHTLTALSQEQRPWYLMARRLGEAQTHSRHCGEENISYLWQKNYPSSLAAQPTAIVTELSSLPTPR